MPLRAPRVASPSRSSGGCSSRRRCRIGCGLPKSPVAGRVWESRTTRRDFVQINPLDAEVRERMRREQVANALASPGEADKEQLEHCFADDHESGGFHKIVIPS